MWYPRTWGSMRMASMVSRKCAEVAGKVQNIRGETAREDWGQVHCLMKSVKFHHEHKISRRENKQGWRAWMSILMSSVIVLK